jgi:hypothetical protein
MIVFGQVALFNLLQKQMSALKRDRFKPFKNEFKCEVANLLLLSPNLLEIYIPIDGNWYTIPSADSIAGYCSLTGESVAIMDVQNDDRHNKEPDKFTDFTTRNMLCKPVFYVISGFIEECNNFV